jgi:hypothetical protein
MSIRRNWLVLFFFIFSLGLSLEAIEPMDPKAMCLERMVAQDERLKCASLADKLKLDWYAATACQAINDNKKFLNCWQKIAGGEFNTDDLSRCVENIDNSDDSILTCIVSLKDKRSPASRSSFQSLKVKSKNK